MHRSCKHVTTRLEIAFIYSLTNSLSYDHRQLYIHRNSLYLDTRFVLSFLCATMKLCASTMQEVPCPMPPTKQLFSMPFIMRNNNIQTGESLSIMIYKVHLRRHLQSALPQRQSLKTPRLACSKLQIPISANYLLALTLNGLSSAALYASNVNRLIKYRAKNLTTLSIKPPFPDNMFRSPSTALTLTGRGGCVAEPNVYPFDWKTALPFAPESFAALRTAAVRPAGLAPRMVSTTEPDLRTRKVGILFRWSANILYATSVLRPAIPRRRPAIGERLPWNHLRGYSKLPRDILTRIHVYFAKL